MAPRKRLGALLIDMGVIDEHQLNSALGHQKQWGGKLGSVLVQKGLCKEADVVRVLSVHLGMPVIHLHEAKIDPRAIKMVSRQVVEKLRVFPVELQGSGRSEVLTIAMAEPSDLSIVDQIAFHTGKRIKPVLTGESEIATAIALYYSDAQGSKISQPAAAPRPASIPNSAGFAPSGPNVTGRVSPSSISQRPAPPHIAPPVMAPSSRPGIVDAARPPSGRFPPPQPSFSLPTQTPPRYAPPPIPAVPERVVGAPLDEIEPIDLDSLPGMPAAPGEPSEVVPGLEPLAAEFTPTGWDEAPSSEPAAPMNWDDAPAEEPAPQAAAAPPAAPVQASEEVGWADVQFSAPPPTAADEALRAYPHSEFGEARDWSHDAAARAPEPADAFDEPTDELPADAILGTAEDEAGAPEDAPPASDPHQATAHEAAPHESDLRESDLHENDSRDEASQGVAAQAVAVQEEPPPFFEAPSDPEAEATAALAAPAEVAPVESAQVAPLAVDPWADLVSDAAPEPGPAQEPSAAPEVSVADAAAVATAPESAPEIAAPEAVEPAPEHAAPPQVALGAFNSEPGSIVAPDAWGDVADPLAAHVAPAAPVETSFGEAASVEEASAEAAPTEPAPIEVAQTDAAPTEAAPTEAAPVEESPVDAAPAYEEPTSLESTDVAFTSDEFAPVVVPASEHAQDAALSAQAEPDENVPLESASELSTAFAAEPSGELAAASSEAPPEQVEAPIDEVVAHEDAGVSAQEEPAQEEPAQEEPAHEEPAQEAPAQEEPGHEHATWLGQGLSGTSALSSYDVETLAAVGIDAADGMGAMRLLAGLLRALAAKQIIDLGELTVDLYAQRSEGPAAADEPPAPEGDVQS